MNAKYLSLYIYLNKQKCIHIYFLYLFSFFFFFFFPFHRVTQHPNVRVIWAEGKAQPFMEAALGFDKPRPFNTNYRTPPPSASSSPSVSESESTSHSHTENDVSDSLSPELPLPTDVDNGQYPAAAIFNVNDGIFVTFLGAVRAENLAYFVGSVRLNQEKLRAQKIAKIPKLKATPHWVNPFRTCRFFFFL